MSVKMKIALFLSAMLPFIAACSREAADKADTAFSIGGSIMGILSVLGTGLMWIVIIGVAVIVMVFLGQS